MTDETPTDATEVADDAVEVTATEVTNEPEPEPQSKREARYRTQLRETEAERDQLAGRIEAMQRAEVERLAQQWISKPSALWSAEVTLADLLDDDGHVDPEKVTAAAHAARQALGLEPGDIERKKRGPVVPQEGTGGRQHASSSWVDAFK